jgi:hypothetical protein
MDLDWSTWKTTSGMSGTFLAECDVGGPGVRGAVALNDRRGLRGAGTSAKPTHGHTGCSREVGDGLAGRRDRHAL